MPEQTEVKHPSHYGGDGPHEVVKCLRAWGLTGNAFRFNAVKYLARAGKKGNTIEARLADLGKAIEYIRFEIEDLEAERVLFRNDPAGLPGTLRKAPDHLRAGDASLHPGRI